MLHLQLLQGSESCHKLFQPHWSALHAAAYAPGSDADALDYYAPGPDAEALDYYANVPTLGESIIESHNLLPAETTNDAECMMPLMQHLRPFQMTAATPCTTRAAAFAPGMRLRLPSAGSAIMAGFSSTSSAVNPHKSHQILHNTWEAGNDPLSL